MGGLSVMGMRQVPIGQAAGLVVGLGLKKVACLLSSHQVHVAAPCTVIHVHAHIKVLRHDAVKTRP